MILKQAHSTGFVAVKGSVQQALMTTKPTVELLQRPRPQEAFTAADQGQVKLLMRGCECLIFRP